MTSAVLFDIDGTLVDSTYHHAVAWHRAFARITTAPPLWRIHRTIGMGGAEVGPLPGAADLVHQLRAEGYLVALVSSGDPAPAWVASRCAPGASAGPNSSKPEPCEWRSFPVI